MMTVLRAAAIALVALLHAPEEPGALLASGMELYYGSGGTEQPAWVVERVTRNVSLGGMSACVDARIRVNPARPEPEARLYCVRGDTLFAWDTTAQTHRPLRPVGPRMTLEVRGRTTVSTYETGEVSSETISGLRVPVVTTTVTTRDSTGRVTRRLRERFAVGLTTATGGVFDVPDSTQASGWRMLQAFDLVRIVRQSVR